MHKILKNKLDLPNYYGENANALWDWLTAWVTLPLTVEWEFFKDSKNMLGRRSGFDFRNISRCSRRNDR